MNTEDTLKKFIREHREELDMHEPSDLWNKIDSKLDLKASPGNASAMLNKAWWGAGLLLLCICTWFYFGKKADPVPSNDPSEIVKQEQVAAEKTQSAAAAPAPEKQVLAEQITQMEKQVFSTPFVPLSSLSSNENLTQNFNESPAPVLPEKSVLPLTNTVIPPDSDSLFHGVKRIVINGDFFDISIRGQESEEVTLKKEFRSSGKGIYTLAENNYEIITEKKDSVLNISVKCNGIKKPVLVIGTLSVMSKLSLTIPSSADVIVNNSSGNIRLNGVNGNTVQLSTTCGDIISEGMQTGLKASTACGDIFLKNIKGDVITESGSGNQRLREINGKVKCSSASGDLSFLGLSGTAEITSGSGNQSYDDFSGSITSKASAGDINMDKVKGTLSLKTGSGNIRAVDAELTSSSELKTNSGDIFFNLKNPINELSFDLQTISGDLVIKKENTLLKENNQLLLNKGPILIKASSASGNQLYK